VKICATVKILKSWMSCNLATETRDPSYVCLATRPQCPKNNWRGKSRRLHQRESSQNVSQGSNGV